MKTYLVTVKLPKRSDHDPHNKKAGNCPINPGKLCSDTTGEHHTVQWEGDSLLSVIEFWEIRQQFHVTRVEEV